MKVRKTSILSNASLLSLLAALPAVAQETADVAEVTFDATAMPVPSVGLLAAVGAIPIVIALVVSLFLTICLWRILSKAGLPGFGAIVPIWNAILLCKAAGKPAWWFLLLCIPGVQFIIGIILCIGLAKQFGKGTGFGLGLSFLSFIFFPILAFGGAQYGGMELPDAAPATAGAIANPRTAQRPGLQQPVAVQGGNYTVTAWLAIVAVLCFIALVLIQYLEFNHYKSPMPQHGRGNVWPAKAP